MNTYNLYYRSFIKGCNYSCYYCPFSKIQYNKSSISKDKHYFRKFIESVKFSTHRYRIKLIPRGELLILPHYWTLLGELCSLENVNEVVVQTNLSSSLDWLRDSDYSKLILWCTYHPTQVDQDTFLSQLRQLEKLNIRYTVGTVGVKEDFDSIESLELSMRELASKPYLWINAYKDKPQYYTDKDLDVLKGIDPLFEINLKTYDCHNYGCKAGESAFFIQYNGRIEKCWQSKITLGNFNSDDIADISAISQCSFKSCGCYIGYSNLKYLELDNIYNSVMGRLYRDEDNR